MKTFEFSPNVITKIISELQDADEYIRIAVFQIHNREVFNVLNVIAQYYVGFVEAF